MIIKYVLISFAVMAVLIVVIEFVRIRSLIKNSSGLVKKSVPYTQAPPSPSRKFLIIGDSTGVGTGTSSAKFSLAGRLGTKYPDATVENKSVNGMRTKQLVELVKSNNFNSYDLVVIHIGGNDIIRLQNLGRSTDNIKEVLDALSKNNKRVAVFTTGDLGQSDFFPWFVRPLYHNRSLNLRNMVKKMSQDYNNVSYVDLFEFPKKLESNDGYASDKLHLSDSGYKLWFEALLDGLKNLDPI